MGYGGDLRPQPPPPVSPLVGAAGGPAVSGAEGARLQSPLPDQAGLSLHWSISGDSQGV